MTIAEEIKRLKEGPSVGDLPVGGLISHATARCPGNADQVLKRAREVLLPVLRALLDGVEDERIADQIPRWFRDECFRGSAGGQSPESTGRSQEERWSLENWLHWFTGEERQWYWWDAVVVSADVLEISLVTVDWPVPIGSFEWMLRAAGAAEVEFDF